MPLSRCVSQEMPEEIAIWGVEGSNISEFGEHLSPAVLAAVERVAGEVVFFLDTRDGPRTRRAGAVT